MSLQFTLCNRQLLMHTQSGHRKLFSFSC